MKKIKILKVKPTKDVTYEFEDRDVVFYKKGKIIHVKSMDSLVDDYAKKQGYKFRKKVKK